MPCLGVRYGAVLCHAVRYCAVLCRAACFSVLTLSCVQYNQTRSRRSSAWLISSAQLSSAEQRTATKAQQRTAVRFGTERCCAVLRRAVPCCSAVFFRTCQESFRTNFQMHEGHAKLSSSGDQLTQLSSAPQRQLSSAVLCSAVRCRAVPCGAVLCYT